MTKQNEQDRTKDAKPLAMTMTRAFFAIVLPVIVVALGVAGSVALMKTQPEAGRKKRWRSARLVETMTIEPTDRRVVVNAMGTVEAARVARVQPRVSGQVVRLADDLVPGGVFREGDPLLWLDPKDFELAVTQREAELVKAQSALDIERGEQAYAAYNYERLPETSSRGEKDLILRKPQLLSARATVESAQAALERAKLDLERTTVRAPFNAVVQGRDVNKGMQVNSATSVATLLGTDEFWVTVSIPVDRLKWIDLPESGSDEGSTARVYNEAAWGAGVWREGRVRSLMADIESEGRMARVILSVPDPLALTEANEGKPTLLIDSYVRVEIDGKTLEDVFVLDRSLAHEGGRVWVMNDEDRLEIRDTTIAFRGPRTVCVAAGLAAGERVVTTNLSAPVEGMALRTAAESAPEGEGAKQDATKGSQAGEEERAQ